MNEDEDYRKRFLDQLSNSYGQMESVLGADGYKAFLEGHKADQQRSISWAFKQRAIGNAISALSLIAFLASIPVNVWLWKWAINS